MKRTGVYPLLLALSLAGCSAFSISATASTPTLTLHDDNPNGKFGDWYTGAVPPNASNDKPVILFVQGLHSDISTWTATDDYYSAAYNAGYRTAFVQLKDADGEGGSMWTNGKVLADVIKKVADYYGVSRLNVVAHSKGGIDTQTALVHYGVSPYVNVVHQLSTPNKGSELADMAYSTWTWWLASIIGMRDDAVYSLQTSYMANFRKQTDRKPENNQTATYMAAGSGDDGWFSATWFAHAFLPGSDDGAVSVDSAFGLPYGIRAFQDNGSQKLSHSQMRQASKTWARVQSKLSLAAAKISSAQQQDQDQDTEEESSMILRGGKISGEQSEHFHLESGVDKISVDVMTSSPETKMVLISPSGKRYLPDGNGQIEDPASIFAKAVHNVFDVKKPEKGKWTVQLSGKDDAYFLYASVKGGAEIELNAKKKVYRQGDAAKLSFHVDGGTIKNSKSLEANVIRSTNDKSKAIKKIKWKQAASGEMTAQFEVPSEPGVYNLSLDVTGVDKHGEMFTRSLLYNFAVTDKNGELPRNPAK